MGSEKVESLRPTHVKVLGRDRAGDGSREWMMPIADFAEAIRLSATSSPAHNACVEAQLTAALPSRGQRVELTVYRPHQDEATVYRGRLTSTLHERVQLVGGVYRYDGKWPEVESVLSFPSEWCEIEWLDTRSLEDDSFACTLAPVAAMLTPTTPEMTDNAAVSDEAVYDVASGLILVPGTSALDWLRVRAKSMGDRAPKNGVPTGVTIRALCEMVIVLADSIGPRATQSNSPSQETK